MHQVTTQILVKLERLETELNFHKTTELLFENSIQMFISVLLLVNDAFIFFSQGITQNTLFLAFRLFSLVFSLISLSLGFSRFFLVEEINLKFKFYPDSKMLLMKFSSNFICLLTRPILFLSLYRIIPLKAYVCLIIYMFKISFVYLNLKKLREHLNKGICIFLGLEFLPLLYVPLFLLQFPFCRRSESSKMLTRFSKKNFFYYSTFFFDFWLLNIVFFKFFPYKNNNDTNEFICFSYYYLNNCLFIVLYVLEFVFNYYLRNKALWF